MFSFILNPFHLAWALLAFDSEKIRIYRTIFFSVVLYGCETWSLTSREERRLMVSENSVLRGIDIWA